MWAASWYNKHEIKLREMRRLTMPPPSLFELGLSPMLELKKRNFYQGTVLRLYVFTY